ncbi:MAG: single-stranded DNA-binding protein [Candidatus Muiribacteriota bacterium]
MYSKFFAIGRLTRDIEIMTTSTGKQLGKITIATDNGYGDNKKTEFFNGICFGKTAELLDKYTSKGDLIMVEGTPQINKWEDKNGNKRRDFEVVINTVKFLQTKDKKDEFNGEIIEEDLKTPDEDPFGEI